jgi:biopolymer transport protein ExbB
MQASMGIGLRVAALVLAAIVGIAVVERAVLTPAAHAADEPAATDGNHPSTETKSGFLWFVESSGLIGLFILLLSIYFVATVVQLFIQFRPDVAAPPTIVRQAESSLESRDIQGMYNLVAADDSFFSRILATGIAEMPHGLNEARDAMERQADAITVEMEKKISILAVLGTLGPMIGLLGTLKGMISSFSVIALEGVALKPSAVAKGISEALILTLEGVFLSVPAIFFFSLFRNRVATISVNTFLMADDFLRRISRLVKAKAGATAPRP